MLTRREESMNISTARKALVAALSLFLFLTVRPACMVAQQVTATLVGTATDTQGAAIPEAQVTATNTSTGVSRPTTSNAQGDYRIEFLPVGSYSVTVNASGFKKFVQNNVVLTVDQTQRVDARLVVGAPNQTVTVNSAPPLVNTSTAEIGSTVEHREITTLPIVGRNVYSLLTLTPGVQQSTNSIQLGFPQQQTFINGGSDNGVGSVAYYLDGGINMTFLRNTGNIVPNPDAVEEFRVETNNYNAEYGRFGGGVVTVVTRSGTNNLHGSLFEFYRTKGLNASPWGSTSNPPLHRNQFGGTVGGPIHKNRAFFFGSYSGLRQVTSTVLNTAVVPTALERQGNFSQSAVIPIDPTTGAPFNYKGVPGWIPPSRLDPTAQNLLNPPSGLPGIPSANQPGNVFQGLIVSPYNTDEYLAKVDHSLTQMQRLIASYYETSGVTSIQNSSGGTASPNLPWSLQQYSWRQQNANLSDTWTISPTFINQAWVTYTRNFGGRLSLPQHSLHDYGSDFQPQGGTSLPDITVSGYFRLGEAIDGPIAGTNFYSVRDVVDLTKGNHSISFGAEASLNKDIQNTSLNNYGVFSFTGTATQLKGSTKYKGNALADFLLGLPVTMNQDTPVTELDNSWSYGLFVQDNFRASQRVTFNLGLRYDIQTPPTDPLNRESTFVAGRQSKAVPAAPVGQLFAGDSGVGRGVIPIRKYHISPRLGVAWDPFGDGKTSVRAGAGLFFGSNSGDNWNSMANFLPFAVRAQFNNVASLTHPYANLPGGVSPFPYVYRPSNPRYITPATIEGVDLNYAWPYTYQTNFSLQRQITNDLSLTAAYVGAFSYNLPFADDLNYPIFSNTATTQNVNARRPIDTGTLAQIYAIGSTQLSVYNGFQLIAEQRAWHRVSFRAFYVYSKTTSSVLEDDQVNQSIAPQDYNALSQERGPSNYDIRNSFVGSAIWNLSYSKSSNPILRNLLNGWEISPIVSLQSGAPFSLLSGKDNNLDGNNTDRPNLVPGKKPTLDPHRSRAAVTNAWFNTAAFSPNGPGLGVGPGGADGDIPRNYLNGPGYRDVDMGVFRNLAFANRFTIQGRLEATNIFNMVSLSAPNATLTSSLFGKIRSAAPPRQLQLGLRLTF